MAKEKIPATPGIRFLKQNKAEFEVFQYDYETAGGTAQTAEELKVEEHAVVKTLVFENESGECVLALQHGDMKVSAKNLARIAGVKKFAPASADLAMKNTGYKFGGTSPFGTRKALRVFAQESLFELDKIYINGGGQGLIVGIAPDVLTDILKIEKADISS
jgi:Cys-tRNA(Pro) deacylase